MGGVLRDEKTRQSSSKKHVIKYRETGASFIKHLQIVNCNLQFQSHWSFPWKRAGGLAAAKDFARVSMETTNQIETASRNLQEFMKEAPGFISY